MKKTFLSRSVIALMLALMVSIGSIVGGTIAWFNDEVTSEKNIIASGTLKAKMYYTDDNVNWLDVEDANTKAMFDYANWEPGYTTYKGLKIENNGSLAFEYTLKLIPAGTISKLAEVIDVYVSDAKPASRTELGTQVGTLKDMVEGKLLKESVVLKAQAPADIFYITLKMQESANNDYQGLELGAFDIQLMAVQAPVETDGFGTSEYDENAGEAVVGSEAEIIVKDVVFPNGIEMKNVPVAQVYNGNQLKNLFKEDTRAAQKFQVIEINSDLNMSGITWEPVDIHADKTMKYLNILGNGHTISNLTVNGQAMFTRFAGVGDVVISDLTFDNATVKSSAINTSILTVQSYKNTYLYNVDVKNSSITGGYKVAPLIATVYNESDSTITLHVDHCDVSNTTVEATAYDFCTTGMVAFVYEDNNDKVVFTNSTVSDVTLIVPIDSYKAHAAVYAADSTKLYNEVDGVTVSNVKVLSKKHGLWYDAESRRPTYYIGTAADLMKFSQYRANGTIATNEADVHYVVLTDDIDLSGYDWLPLNMYFTHFDGQDHTISNLTAPACWRAGFAGYMGGGTIKNVTFENLNVAGAQAGLLAGSTEGATFENITIKGSNSVTFAAYSSDSYTETWNGVGALIGWCDSATVKNVELVNGATITVNANDYPTAGNKLGTELIGCGNDYSAGFAINGTVTTK